MCRSAHKDGKRRSAIRKDDKKVKNPLYLCRSSFYVFFFFHQKKRRIFGPGTNPTRISNSYMISSEILLVYSIYSTVVYSQVDHVQLFFINLFIQDNAKARHNEDSTSKQSEISKRCLKKKRWKFWSATSRQRQVV